MKSIQVGQLLPHHPIVNPPKKTIVNQTGRPSFQQVLDNQLLTFSHHAEQRLKQRGIKLQPEQLMKLENALDRAAAKGSKDSLLLYQDMAFIVNVKNRTVITAIDGAAMKDNVFTQIDSTVIVGA